MVLGTDGCSRNRDLGFIGFRAGSGVWTPTHYKPYCRDSKKEHLFVEIPRKSDLLDCIRADGKLH